MVYCQVSLAINAIPLLLVRLFLVLDGHSWLLFPSTAGYQPGVDQSYGWANHCLGAMEHQTWIIRSWAVSSTKHLMCLGSCWQEESSPPPPNHHDHYPTVLAASLWLFVVVIATIQWQKQGCQECCWGLSSISLLKAELPQQSAEFAVPVRKMTMVMLQVAIEAVRSHVQ